MAALQEKHGGGGRGDVWCDGREELHSLFFSLKFPTEKQATFYKSSSRHGILPSISFGVGSGMGRKGRTLKNSSCLEREAPVTCLPAKKKNKNQGDRKEGEGRRRRRRSLPILPVQKERGTRRQAAPLPPCFFVIHFAFSNLCGTDYLPLQHTDGKIGRGKNKTTKQQQTRQDKTMGKFNFHFGNDTCHTNFATHLPLPPPLPHIALPLCPWAGPFLSLSLSSPLSSIFSSLSISQHALTLSLSPLMPHLHLLPHALLLMLYMLSIYLICNIMGKAAINNRTLRVTLETLFY